MLHGTARVTWLRLTMSYFVQGKSKRAVPSIEFLV